MPGSRFSTTPLVSRTRCSVLTLPRRAGTQQAAQFAVAWAPALQRTAEGALRCVRGTRASLWRTPASTPSLRAQRSNPDCHRGKTLDCFAALAMTECGHGHRSFNLHFQSQTHVRSLAAFTRALLRRLAPMKEGAGKTGSRLAPVDRHARSRLRYNAQRETGQPETSRPSLRSGWNGLCRDLPGERCTIAPVALRMADARARSGRHITARLGAQTPGARTTRFRRTPITPVVRAMPSLTALRPAKPIAPMQLASTAARPAFVTIAIRPSSLGRSGRNIRQFRISVKWNIFASKH
jgi:hypothetical protein